jgi:hypothetical protein
MSQFGSGRALEDFYRKQNWILVSVLMVFAALLVGWIRLSPSQITESSVMSFFSQWFALVAFGIVLLLLYLQAHPSSRRIESTIRRAATAIGFAALLLSLFSYALSTGLTVLAMVLSALSMSLE